MNFFEANARDRDFGEQFVGGLIQRVAEMTKPSMNPRLKLSPFRAARRSFFFPLPGVLAEQDIQPLVQGGVPRVVLIEPRLLAAQPDEFSPVVLAVLVQPIREDQPRRVVGGSGDNRGEKGPPFRFAGIGPSQRFFLRSGIIWALLAKNAATGFRWFFQSLSTGRERPCPPGHPDVPETRIRGAARCSWFRTRQGR